MHTESMNTVDGTKFSFSGRLIKTARLDEEWYEDVTDPVGIAKGLKQIRPRADVFSFWQRLPDTSPRFPYARVVDPVAAIPITTYANWWDKQIDAKTRNMVRKAEKKGVVVRKIEFDDAFVAGMTELFNETPVRQGKPFWHYGKDSGTIKREFSRFLFREELFGAYVGSELVGFIFIANTGNSWTLGQIISKIAHRDKAPTNALVAKAVEHAAEQAIPYLSYAKWVDGSLGEFKRSNGFLKFDLPRYFLPLTLTGNIYVALKLYRGAAEILPRPVVRVLKDGRSRFHAFRAGRALRSNAPAA